MNTPALPSPNARWTPSRKAAVVIAHRRAKPAARAALMARYALTDDELAIWAARFDRHGQRGLKATETRRLRRTSEERA